MSADPIVNTRSVLVFTAMGLAMGAFIGWLASISWLGIVIAALLAVVVIATLTDMYFLTGIVLIVIEPVWNVIARVGEQLAGIDPDGVVPAPLRVIYAVAFGTALCAIMFTEYSWLLDLP